MTPGAGSAGADRRPRATRSVQGPPGDLPAALASCRSPHIARRSRSFGGRWPFSTPTHAEACLVAEPPGVPRSLPRFPRWAPDRSFGLRLARLSGRWLPVPPAAAVAVRLRWGAPSAEASGLPSVLAPLRSPAVQRTLDLAHRSVKRRSRLPQGYPRTFSVVPNPPGVVHRLTTGRCTTSRPTRRCGRAPARRRSAAGSGHATGCGMARDWAAASSETGSAASRRMAARP